MTFKTCTKCKTEKPKGSEHFAKSQKSPDGLQSWCRACFSTYNREHHAKKVAARMLGA